MKVIQTARLYQVRSDNSQDYGYVCKAKVLYRPKKLRNTIILIRCTNESNKSVTWIGVPNEGNRADFKSSWKYNNDFVPMARELQEMLNDYLSKLSWVETDHWHEARLAKIRKEYKYISINIENQD